MPIKEAHLRREAYPVAWENLSDSQRDAGEAIIHSLARAEVNPQLSQARTQARDSRVLFLSGGRGTGKTTLLVSLRELFAGPAPNNMLSEERKGEPARSAARQMDSGVADALRTHKGRITWLEPIDMDPLPPGTNLLAAILARIEDAVDASQRKELGQGRGLLDPLCEGDQHLQRFRALQNDLVLAWEGNLQQRAQGIDLDQYATEVIRTERDKIDVNQRLQEALDAMVKLILPHDPKRIFVLPIDDFDVNPDRAVDLLKLIRILWAPRLFTLFLGDLPLLEHVIYTQTCGKLFHIFGTANTPATRTQQEQLVASANQVAADALRKMIPPSQRLFLTEQSVANALSFSFGDAPMIRKLLERWPIYPMGLPWKPKGDVPQVAGVPINNLADLLVTDIFTEKDLEPTTPYLYTGIALLNAPIRHLLDTWLLLQKHLPEAKEASLRKTLGEKNASNERLVRLSEELLRQAIYEDPRLSFQARQFLLRRFARSPFFGEWELDTEGFTFRARLGSRLELDMSWLIIGKKPALNSDKPDPAMVFSCKVVARRIRRWSARVRLDHEDTEADWPIGRAEMIDGGDNRLSLRTRAALILYHDLLRFSGLGTVEGSIKDQKIAMRAYTEWTYGVLEPLQVPWFLSIWDTFWEFAIFARVWNEGERIARRLQENHSEQDSREQTLFLAFTWIVGGICALSATRPDESLRVIRNSWDDKGPAEKLPWGELAAKIKELSDAFKTRKNASRYDARTRKLSGWLVNLALLMLPETGIFWKVGEGKDLRQELLDGNPMSIFEGLDQAIRHARLRRLGEFVNTYLGVSLVANATVRDALHWRELRHDEKGILSSALNNDWLQKHDHLCPTPTEVLSAMRHFRLKRAKKERFHAVQKHAASIDWVEATRLQEEIRGIIEKDAPNAFPPQPPQPTEEPTPLKPSP